MSSSTESIIDGGAAPAESCDPTKPNDAIGVAPSPTAAGTPEPDQEKTDAAPESNTTPETAPSNPSTEAPSPPSDEAIENKTSLATGLAEADANNGDASGQGEKRKEPDALTDAPTQADSAGNGNDDAAEAAPAKKQKTDEDAVGEPTPVAALASSE
ncbi:OxoGdeHyase C incomplete domain containing protein [Pandoravirus quercus]|uniref:OxoGdeHyase C incomplete domain containing protein n=2 Tax=Pandoravirus TaxID=2060084 RepID=A0A2U7U8C5_9VIRU|nr:OxoGdeHyase C incomplete domain containing protein [Pandoravirus quercus]AVK74642.1 OxoGdeHyase C incomplete domain containing protein [Pandoravirus quercus]QBZ80820.1 OxoGdeHyase C superfamily incomplete domain containing protein [Pandoravirus celtis]